MTENIRPAQAREMQNPSVCASRPTPAVSIVIPVYNEEKNLSPLLDRLLPVVHQIQGGAEVIFVDDGSSDHSLDILRDLAASASDIRALSLDRNCGQHAAVFAGFDFARGRTVVTMDADLQNHPEDIPKLLSKISEGFDVVAGWRTERKDGLFRRWASRQMNRFARHIVGAQFHDWGCMLRAYSRSVVDSMLQCKNGPLFIPALACRFSKRMAEIPVGHDPRRAGESKYTLGRLLKLQADLVAGSMTAPFRRRQAPVEIKEKINFDEDSVFWL
ncbi:MAG TPA: glycosyltransferase [Acidobacteriota bacterium]